MKSHELVAIAMSLAVAVPPDTGLNRTGRHAAVLCPRRGDPPIGRWVRRCIEPGS